MRRIGISEYLFQELGESFPHPHNAYLQLLLDNGVIGAIPILIFYFLLVKYSMSLFKDSRSPIFVGIGGICLSLVLAFLAASLGSQSFYPREGSVGMWCAIGLMLRVYVQRKTVFGDLRPEKYSEEEVSKNLWMQPEKKSWRNNG